MIAKELQKRNLPDILSFKNGEKITTIKDWEIQKEELKKEFQREMYGKIPAAPKSIRFEEISKDEYFCAGKTVLRKVNIICELENGEFSFPVYCTVPKCKPKMTFLLINFRDNVPDKYLPSEELIDNECAAFSFCYEDVTSDDDDFTNKLAGVLFPNGKRENDDAGKIAMWAWAAMRVMDYIETLSEVDAERVTVIGHSRLGKTALVTAAFDDRFYSAASNDSGTCGTAITRNKNDGAEKFSDIFSSFGYWFCKNFQKYATDNIPTEFDQHQLLALIAPRKLAIGSSELDLWADPKGEFLSCVAASEVWKLYGKQGIVHNNEYLNAPDCLHSGDIGYHFRKGLHYFSRTDWLYYLDFYLR